MSRPSPRSTLLVLAGILLLAANLRPAAVTVGPVLEEIRDALGMSGAEAGVLTSLPVIAFAVFGAMAPAAARAIGVHRVTLLALLLLTLGLGVRATADSAAVLLGWSVVALAGMAMANVLLPSLVKLHFPDRVGPVTALYTTVLTGVLAIALVVTVPIARLADSWRAGVGAWALVAVVAALPWLVLIRHDRHLEPTRRSIGFLDVLRTPLGLTMAMFFGIQSLQAYVIFGWFATLWRDAGYDAATAGALVALVAATSVPLALWGPAAVARSERPGRIVVGILLCYPVGYVGLMVAPHDLAVLWAVLVGIGAAVFPLVLVLIGLRARTPEGTAALSGVTQSVGYLVAALGPFGIGLLHDATGGWNWPLAALTALTVPQLVLGVLAARPQFVEDQLRTPQRPAAPHQ